MTAAADDCGGGEDEHGEDKHYDTNVMPWW